VGAVGVIVNAGLIIGAFSAIELSTVVLKLALLPKAAANSFNVSKATGAEPTKLETAVANSFNVSKDSGAELTKLEIALRTNNVVAI
jgi:hypothetical protein